MRNTAVLWVIGIDADGYRKHVGVWLGASESAANWRTVCEELVARGLHGVQYIVSDEHAGMVQSMQRVFPHSVHQRCQVHYVRNALTKVASPARRERLVDALRHVWRSTTRTEADARLARLLLKIRPHHSPLADWLEETAACMRCAKKTAANDSRPPTVSNTITWPCVVAPASFAFFRMNPVFYGSRRPSRVNATRNGWCGAM